MNRTVLITGASAGIGKALACRYAQAGDEVLLLARNGNALRELASDIRSMVGTAHVRECNVAEYEEVAAAMHWIRADIGRVDVAILNAGIGGSEEVRRFTSTQFRRVLEVNVMGVASFFEFLIPMMIEQGQGVIAGVSSLADVRGFNHSMAYSASKAALSSLLESARIELKPMNIRVVTVRPGFVRTAMTSRNSFPMPFLMEASEAAERIFKGIERGKTHVAFPSLLVVASEIGRIAPRWLFDWAMRRRKV